MAATMQEIREHLLKCGEIYAETMATDPKYKPVLQNAFSGSALTALDLIHTGDIDEHEKGFRRMLSQVEYEDKFGNSGRG